MRILALLCRRDADTGMFSLWAPARRPLGALQVRRQRQHRHAGDRRRHANDLVGVGHLRQQFRRHEGADLEAADTAGDLREPGDLVVGRNDPVKDLQSIAQTDLDHLNLFPLHGSFLYLVRPAWPVRSLLACHVTWRDKAWLECSTGIRVRRAAPGSFRA